MSPPKTNKANDALPAWKPAEDFIAEQQLTSEPIADSPQSLMYGSALRMLGLREHSAFELSQKLQKKFPNSSADEISETIALLTNQEYISDARFTDALTRTSISKGKGPAHILHKIRQAKVAIDPKQLSNIDWHSEAQKAHQKKFGHLASSPSEQSAQYRFLTSRGYPHDVIMAVLRPKKD